MSMRETALAALHSRLGTALAARSPAPVVLRGETVPQRIPPGGLVVLRDGETVEETPILSPLAWAIEHRAEVEITVAGTTPADRAALLDALLVDVAAAMTADRTLGGAVEWAQPGAPEFQDVEFEGAAAARAAARPRLALVHRARLAAGLIPSPCCWRSPMPRAIGANCRLLMIPETVYGTAPGGDWQRMPFLSCDLGAEQPLLDADVIGVGSNRDPAAPFLDTVTVQGQAVVPVDLVNIGHWLRLLLGPPITTGTSPNFIHSFGSGAAALPSNSIEIGYPDVPSYDVCTGVRADTLEIDFSPTGPATATFGLMGQGSARTGASVRRHAGLGALHRLQQGAGLDQPQRLRARPGHRRAAHLRQRHGDGAHHPRRSEDRGRRSRHRPLHGPGDGALRGHDAADPGAERHRRRVRLRLHHRRQPQPDRHAARGLPGAGQDADRGAGRRGGHLRLPRRLQRDGDADDDGGAAEPAGGGRSMREVHGAP